jgi:isopentenyl-diphosphate delta-isomerase
MSNSTTEELVVLVNEQNEVIGTTPKATVHGRETPLHRAFSCFIFNDEGEFLLQQRAFSKKTWPGIWSNSCCGHPSPDEKNEDAAKRRLEFELGLTDFSYLREVAPYRYCFVRDGVMENEICPIILVITNQEPVLNPDEVEAVKWISWQDFVHDTVENPQNWSEWCVEETQILEKNSEFLALKESLGIESLS